MFLDPVRKVIGMAHAGWKGTILKIGAKTVQKMCDTYGCEMANILVAIGPSIGPCHFQVGEEVKAIFDKAFNHVIIDKIVNVDMDYNGDSKRYMIDLWSANESSLLAVGIKKEHITKTDLCTMCHKTVFFSHRGSKGKRGAMVAMMALI
jgi:YfiH family protein